MRILIAFLMVAGSVVAQEPIPVEAWVQAQRQAGAEVERKLSAAVTQAESQLEAVRNARIGESTRLRDGEWMFSSRKEKLAAIAEKQKEVASAKRKLWGARAGEPQVLASAAKKGDIGTIVYSLGELSPSPVASGAAVVGSAEAVALMASQANAQIMLHDIRVTQVLSDDSFLGEAGRTTLLFTGFDTSEMVDGRRLANIGIVYVTGPTTYPTALGTNTVVQVRKVSDEELDALQKAASKLPGQDRNRQWSDISGSFKVDAELLDFDGKTVFLRKQDGSESKVPFAKLSKGDKQYVQEQLGAP